MSGDALRALESVDVEAASLSRDGDDPTRRNHRLSTMLRRREALVLRRIAEAWGVPPATAAWAILSERLAAAERRAPQWACEDGVAIAAAVLARLIPASALPDRSGSAASAPGPGLAAPADGAPGVDG